MHPGIHAVENREKPAYIMAGSGKVMTYGELDSLSNQGSQLFRKLSLKRGDHVAILLENHPLFFAICWAAHRSGLYYTAISHRLQEDEVRYIVEDCGAQVLITSMAQRDLAARLRVEIPGIRRYMIDGVVDGYESLEEALAAQPDRPIDDQCEGADMLYSSGTTGRPKGVKRPLREESSEEPDHLQILVTALYGLTSASIYLSPAPCYHSAPLRFNLAIMRIGGTCVIMEYFDEIKALEYIEKYQVTHSQWVPTMFVRLLKLPMALRTKYDLSSMQVAIHAAAPCPVPVKEQMIAWWGPILHEYYAGTEGNGFCCLDSEQWLEHKGSVGYPLSGTIHIVGENDEELPVGEIGVVYFGDGNPFSYHNDPEKTRQSTHPSGWTTLGDMGYVDADGYLYLTDRKSFMIISGGVNVYPQEAENVLIMHPQVADCAVFGVPNEVFGEEVKAVVQPVDISSAGKELAEELISFCRAQLSHIKCPRSIDFSAELPRHPTGKLYKRLLKERYWQGHETHII